MVEGVEGLDMKRAWIYRFISIRFRIISPRKKHEGESQSHLQKFLNGLCRRNLLQSQWIIFGKV